MIAVVKIKKPIGESWKNFKKELPLLGIHRLEFLAKKLDSDLKSWEKAIKKALGTPIPVKYLHRRRPSHRRFTYKVSGQQLEHIKTKVNAYKKGQGFVIHSWAEIGVPYAKYTDMAKPKRADGKTPAWKDWMYDVLFDKGRDGIISVNDLFELLLKETKEAV